MDYIAVHAERVKGNLESHASLSRVFLRSIDNGRIRNSYEETEYGRMPLVWIGSIPHSIISGTIMPYDFGGLQESVTMLQEHSYNKIETIKEVLEEKRERSREGTKTHHNLETKLLLAENALSNIKESFVLKRGFTSDELRGAYYHLILPPIPNKDISRFLSRYYNPYSSHNNTVASLYRHLGMPYSIVSIEDGMIIPKNVKPNYRMIANAVSLSFDIETDNWEEILLEYLKDESHRNIAIEYLESRGYDSNMINEMIEDTMSIPRRRLRKRMKDDANKNKGEMITLMTVNTREDSILISRLKHDTDMYIFSDPVNGDISDVPIISVDKKSLFSDKLAGIVSDKDPLIVGGHNIVRFDLPKTMVLSGSLPIGIDDTTPIVSMSTGEDFMKVYSIKGRDIIEPSYYFMLHEKTWSNDLDTVTRFLNPSVVSKSMSHADLSEATRLAIGGDHNAVLEISEYAWSDGQKPLANMERLLREVYAASTLYNATMLQICTTSPKSLGGSFWSDDMVMRGVLAPYEIQMHNMSLDNMDKDTKYLYNGMTRNRSIDYKNFDRNIMLERIIGRIADNKEHGIKGGTHEAILLRVYPYLSAFSKHFSRINNLEDTINTALSMEDNYSAARLLAHVENLFDLPLFDAMSNTSSGFRRKDNISEWQDKRYTELYGLDKGSLADIIVSVNNEYIRLYNMLKKQDIIGITGNYVVIRPDCDTADRIMDEGTRSIVLSEGLYHGISRDRFLFHSGNRIISSGFSNPKQNKGLRNDYEKRLLSDYYRILFEERYADALSFLTHNINRLVSGNDESVRVYEKRAGRDYHDYSGRARGIWIDAHMENKVMEGETSIIEYEEEDHHDKMGKRFMDMTLMLIGSNDGARMLAKKMVSDNITPIELELMRTMLPK
ncbi:MAG: hypothetical protein ACMXYL_01980 [Candidatus Woesearchaeota archaeon]